MNWDDSCVWFALAGGIGVVRSVCSFSAGKRGRELVGLLLMTAACFGAAFQLKAAYFGRVASLAVSAGLFAGVLLSIQGPRLPRGGLHGRKSGPRKHG
jgi:hypothetical protein